MATKPKPSVKKKTTSVRVTKKKRGISKLQALVAAIVLAAVGVLAVVLTHASGTPSYQYSVSRCDTSNGSTSTNAVQDCKNKSAEAMVYRLYKGLLNRDPSASENQYWTQQFAGEREKIAESSLVKKLVATHPDNNQFVVKLYVAMLKRSGTTKEVTSWTNRLKATGAKKWSREKVAYQFAISGEAIRKNQDGLNAYLASAPKVTVVQNAAKAQRQRFDAMLADYQQPAKQNLTKANALKEQTQTLVNAAKATAAKRTVTAAELQAIAANIDIAQANQDKATAYKDDSASKTVAAARLFSKAKDLANYADDIADNSVYGIGKIADRYNATKNYSADTAKVPAAIADQAKAMSSSYAAAEKKLPAPVVAAPVGGGTGGGTGGTSVYAKPTSPDCTDTLGLHERVTVDRYIIRTAHTVNGQSVPVAGCGNRTNGGHVTVEYLKSPLCPAGFTPANVKVGESSHYKYCYKN